MSHTHLTIATACILAAGALRAQDPPPSIQAVGSVNPYSYTSKSQHNQSKDELVLADEHVVRVPRASFLQVGFGKGQLSEGSLLEITSLADGEVQVFDSSDFEKFSYFFNGDAVRIRLHAAPGSKGDHFVVESVAAGDAPGVGPQTICGSLDNRTRAFDRRVARLLFRRGSSTYVCTAFLSGRVNCFSSAGHCFNNSATGHVVQFNVPLSSTSGSIRNPSTSSQYALGSRIWRKGSIGDDWAVFHTRPNTVTRRHAGDVQGTFFRFSSAYARTNRVTGHGADSSPRTYNFVQQSATGTYHSRSGYRLNYRIDTMGGNSGGPVINSTGLVTAIHTNGGCTRTGGANAGTLITNPGYNSARVRLCNLADLRVDSLVPSSTTMATSRVYSARITIKNHGSATSRSCLSAIVLSTNNVISTGDPVLSSISTPSLGLGQSYATTRSFRMPTSTPAGTCYLGGFADRSSSVPELDNGNNTRAVRITCVRDLRPNLRVSRVVSSASTLTPRLAFTLTTTTYNDSLVSAPASSTGLYLSTNSSITTSDSFLGLVSVPILGALRSYSRSVSVRAPSALPSGTCWVGGYADYRRHVAEFSEGDNGLGRAVRCVDTRPDLVVSSIAVSTGSVWQAGGAVTIRTRTSNVGGGSAVASSTSLHLSSDSTITTSDDCLGWHSVPSLAARAFADRSSNVRISRCYGSTIRAYYIGAYADGTQRVGERSEVNNGRAYPTPRRIAAYAGTGRWLDYATPRISNATPTYRGATTANHANWDASVGGSGRICVTARRDAGRLAIVLLSGSSTFNFDAWSNLSLAVPLFAPIAVAIPGSGQGFTTFRLPRFASRHTLRAYTHSLWFNLTPRFSFAGLGNNFLSNLIYP